LGLLRSPAGASSLATGVATSESEAARVIHLCRKDHRPRTETSHSFLGLPLGSGLSNLFLSLRFSDREWEPEINRS
jgi:hypothetical protein